MKRRLILKVYFGSSGDYLNFSRQLQSVVFTVPARETFYSVVTVLIGKSIHQRTPRYHHVKCLRFIRQKCPSRTFFMSHSTVPPITDYTTNSPSLHKNCPDYCISFSFRPRPCKRCVNGTKRVVTLFDKRFSQVPCALNCLAVRAVGSPFATHTPSCSKASIRVEYCWRFTCE